MSAPYDPEHITYFAETDYRNQRTRFGIKSRDRTRHMYVIGKSGVGKSTLLENMAIQDIQNGEGIAVLDPHGSFADKMLDYIPSHRIKDVVYFAPFDTEYPISFNVLEDVGPEKRHLVVSGLMSTFKKIWVDAWSARMEYILSNTLLALLEYPDSTLLGVNRMLSDKDFRKKVVDNISDSAVKAFWTEEFAKYTERMAAEAVPAIQNKIGQLTANPLIRNIIGQPKSSFDIRKVMDEQKILIINLSKGRIGEQNTSLLGSMIITKIYLGAMSRADASPQRMAELPNFYFYVDEFQSFANETFANILSEARKYKLALIIAHQYVAQMEEPVRDAVFGNVGTSISFRVGALDGELLEKVFAPQFTQNDLINLGFAQIYLSLQINDMGSPPFSARTLPPLPKPAISYRNDCVEWSRSVYTTIRGTVETNTRDWFFKDGESKSIPEKKTSGYQGSNPTSQGERAGYQGNKKETTPPDTKRDYEKKPSINKTSEYHTPFKKVFSETTKQTPIVPEKTPPTEETPIVKSTSIETSASLKPEKKVQNTPVSHKPFIKAFSPEVTKENETEQTSPGLTALLNSLSFHKVASNPSDTVEKKDIPNAIPENYSREQSPFLGEKTLRAQVLPVKHAERGPTEKNRDLLKHALQSALQKNKDDPHNSPILTIPSNASIPTSVPEISSTTEIPHHELRKILD